MTNPKAAGQPVIDWKLMLDLLKPEGQQQIVDFINDARTRGGADWLVAIQDEYPLFVWIVDLVCNKTAEEAIDTIAKMHPLLPVRMFAGEHIRGLHGRLKYEIERPRFAAEGALSE